MRGCEDCVMAWSVGPPFAQLNLGSAVAAVAAAVTCCRLSISCSGWFDGSEAADVAVVVAIDPELEMEPQCEKKDIWVAQGEIVFLLIWVLAWADLKVT